MTATPLLPVAEGEEPKKRKRRLNASTKPAPRESQQARQAATRYRQSALGSLHQAITALESYSAKSLRNNGLFQEHRRLKLAYALLSGRSTYTVEELESASGAGTRHSNAMKRRIDEVLAELRSEPLNDVGPYE